MSKKNILIKTNILVCLIILAGFLLTAILSYRANYSSALENVEQITDLTSEGIYYQLSTIFTKPVNVSLTMANDSFLKNYLAKEAGCLEDDSYIEPLKEYLGAYQKKYGFDSVFLISTASGRYYNFQGLDRILTRDNPENVWYYAMLEDSEDYSLNVDNDEVVNANNDITIFVNCKIYDEKDNTIGIIGVGLRVDYLQTILREYQNDFDVNAYLINEQGMIEVSSEHSGYEHLNLFEENGLTDIRDELLGWKEEGSSKSLWSSGSAPSGKRAYVVARYIPEISWHLIVEQDPPSLIAKLRQQLYHTAVAIAAILLIILFVIGFVIGKFNKHILRLTQEKEEAFRKATEQLYDNIYELNITQNRAAGVSTQRYFESLGVPANTPYDKALRVIAEKQIKEEYREGYISMFSPENVMKNYRSNNTHLQYDFMISLDDSGYFWMRIDAYIYLCTEDHSIHMFTYRKNIDAEKRHELKTEKKIQTDEMTGLLNKTATRQHISAALTLNPEKKYAFFILDIDNFKQANDLHGHDFGDYVIIRFTDIMKSNFRTDDILGRIGGDEFVVFIPVNDMESTIAKAELLVSSLRQTCSYHSSSWNITSSIGIALYPDAGTDFDTLYKNADTALYESKRLGKNRYSFFRE